MIHAANILFIVLVNDEVEAVPGFPHRDEEVGAVSITDTIRQSWGRPFGGNALGQSVTACGSIIPEMQAPA